MLKNRGFKALRAHEQSGNAAIIGLIVLAIVALGALTYFTGHLPTSRNAATIAANDEPTLEKAADAMEGKAAPEPETPAEEVAAKNEPAADTEVAIKPGNPVVAKVDGQDITRLDVFNFIQSLPPQTRQLPLEQLFPLAVNQLVNARIINEKTKDVKLDDDPEVQKQLALAKNQITRSVYLQKMVDAKISESRLKKDYDTYVKNFPKVEEVKASHILVKDEAKAKDLIKQLEGGADFAELAKANSTDTMTAANGGQVGYFVKAGVVPAFGEAAFSITPGSYTKEPVKTDLGYHIIKVDEKRQRPPVDYEAAKPFLEAEARREVLEDILADWQKDTKIERFDINGDPVKVEPASGQ